jgi:hypothetical protein
MVAGHPVDQLAHDVDVADVPVAVPCRSSAAARWR